MTNFDAKHLKVKKSGYTKKENKHSEEDPVPIVPH